MIPPQPPPHCSTSLLLLLPRTVVSRTGLPTPELRGTCLWQQMMRVEWTGVVRRVLVVRGGGSETHLLLLPRETFARAEFRSDVCACVTADDESVSDLLGVAPFRRQTPHLFVPVSITSQLHSHL